MQWHIRRDGFCLTGVEHDKVLGVGRQRILLARLGGELLVVDQRLGHGHDDHPIGIEFRHELRIHRLLVELDGATHRAEAPVGSATLSLGQTC